MKTFAAAAFAALAVFGSASAETAVMSPEAQYVLLENINSFNLSMQERAKVKTLALAEARVRAKIDNIELDKSYSRRLPAFSIASAFTFD
jgi:hypothetical protein